MSDAEHDSIKNYEKAWTRYVFVVPFTEIANEIPAKAPEIEVV
jgi:hypothetical protein